jgi:hypothetical protein
MRGRRKDGLFSAAEFDEIRAARRDDIFDLIEDTVGVVYGTSALAKLSTYIKCKPRSIEATHNGFSVLHFAVHNGHPESLEILLANGAKGEFEAIEDLFASAAYSTSEAPEIIIQKLEILARFGYAKDPVVCAKALAFAESNVVMHKKESYRLVYLHIKEKYPYDRGEYLDWRETLGIVSESYKMAIAALQERARWKVAEQDKNETASSERMQRGNPPFVAAQVFRNY